LKTIKVAAIGVGHLGRHHARIYGEMAGIELVAVVDANLKQAAEVAAACHAPALNDFASLVGKVDAVSVAVPTEYHFAVAKPFLEAGAAVLVEKPLTHAVEDAEKLVELAQKHQAILQVGHIERFNPALLALTARLGPRLRPRFIECQRLSPFRFRSADIGVVFDLMIHDLEIVEFLAASPIESLEAVGASVLTAHEDIANARITFANGCVANITASRASLAPQRLMRIYADDYYARVDYQKRQAQVFRRSAELDAARQQNDVMSLKDKDFAQLIAVENLPVADSEPLKAELESFISCVRAGSRPVVSGAEGLRAVRTATTIIHNILRNRGHQ
jgi:predicted dehydrogenase